MSTMHTIDAAETVGRMVELLPPQKQPAVRADPRRCAPRRRQPAAAAEASTAVASRRSR